MGTTLDLGWPERVPLCFDACKRVNGSKHAGGAWICRCPCHDDRTPSLYIYVGSKGALIMRCLSNRAGCCLENILASAGLKMSELFPPESRPEQGAYSDGRQKLKAEPDIKRVEVESYSYVNEEGVELYQVVRYEPKGFAQRRKDATTKQGWTWGLGDSRRVLFRLNKLLGPDGEAKCNKTVFIVEGERKVLALESLGLLATCNVGGTGMGWRPEYSAALRGRQVLVLPDNDESGYRHAEAIMGSLMRSGVRSIRCVNLPGIPPKGDVIDFLVLGGDIDSLRRATIASPEWRVR